MRKLLIATISLVIAATATHAQVLQDINYNYLYDPATPFGFQLMPVKTKEGWDLFFKLQVQDTVHNTSSYTLSWEIRSSLSSREGTPLPNAQSEQKQPTLWTGNISLPDRLAPDVVVAKVISLPSKQAWLFYAILRSGYPINGYLSKETLVPEKFILPATGYKIHSGGGTVVVSYFRDDFPAAAPAYSQNMAKVSPVIKVDTVFGAETEQPITFRHQGLYLVQHDTAVAAGFAFRVQDDYPKYKKLENLIHPLVYVTTKQEYEKLMLSKGDKKAFDKVVLGITKDAERAKIFMRTYFQRVELANEFFSSYKEGWKTDRGMIYIIFGLPDEVIRKDDREIWKYHTHQYKATFHFIRSGTLFDPDNYVLVRDMKFRETWYEAIDLRRNARF